MIDEFTREALAIEVDHSIDADTFLIGLDWFAGRRSRAPVYVGLDDGPELVAVAPADFNRYNDTASVCIDLGPPWQEV